MKTLLTAMIVVVAFNASAALAQERESDRPRAAVARRRDPGPLETQLVRGGEQLLPPDQGILDSIHSAMVSRTCSLSGSRNRWWQASGKTRRVRSVEEASA